MINKILGHHHAILLEGNPSLITTLFVSELEKKGIKVKNNPDIIFLSFESLGIGEARSLIEVAQGAPLGEKKKSIILSFSSITIQAQNALLKLFEDPNPSVEFLITTQSSDGLIGTLKSRLFIVKGEEEGGEKGLEEKKKRNKEVRRFIDASIAERMEMIEKMVKEVKDSGSKHEVKFFLEGLVFEFEQKPKENKLRLEVVLKALDYIGDTSSSVKMLLESVVIGI